MKSRHNIFVLFFTLTKMIYGFFTDFSVSLKPHFFGWRRVKRTLLLCSFKENGRFFYDEIILLCVKNNFRLINIYFFQNTTISNRYSFRSFLGSGITQLMIVYIFMVTFLIISWDLGTPIPLIKHFFFSSNKLHYSKNTFENS